MIQLVIVLIIVVIAAYFTGRKLISQAGKGECDGCHCRDTSQKLEKIARLHNFEQTKKRD